MLTWKGWEYESANGLHMVQSKRHLFKDGVPVCNVKKSKFSIPHTFDGNGGCKRCADYADKNNLDFNK